MNTLGSAKVTWKSAALCLGEGLAAVGPKGYYDFSPDQWLSWARAQTKGSDPCGDAEKIDKLRAALVGLVGVSTREELEAIEAVMRLTPGPAQDRAVAIDAIHALLATMEEPASAGAVDPAEGIAQG